MQFADTHICTVLQLSCFQMRDLLVCSIQMDVDMLPSVLVLFVVLNASVHLYYMWVFIRLCAQHKGSGN